MNRSLSPTYHNQTLSSSALQFQVNQSQTGLIPSATDEVLKLRKELRLKQAEFEKEKAILQQKNDQLESQLKETNARQQSQIQMYEVMINSFKCSDSNTSQLVSQIQASEKIAIDREIQELKDQKRSLQDQIDRTERDCERQLQDKNTFIKDLQLQMEKFLHEKSQLMFQWDTEKKDLMSKLQMTLNEKEQIEVKLELRNQSKQGELQMEVEKMKLEHQREQEKLKIEYEQSLKEIKYLHEQEKYNLEHRVERSTNELKSLIHLVKQKDNEQPVRNREQLEQEINMLNSEVDNIKRQYDQNIHQIQQEKDQAEAKYKKLQAQLEKLKNAPKPIKIDLGKEENENQAKQIKNLKEEVQLLQGENDKLNDQVRKLRREILELQDYTEKVEQNEKKLRQLVKDKNGDQSQLNDIRKQLNGEKKKVIELMDNITQLKEQKEQMQNKHYNEMLEKDDKIIKLSRELREYERKLQEIQQLFNSNRVGHTKNNISNISGFFNDNQQHQRHISYSPISHVGSTHGHQLSQGQFMNNLQGLGNQSPKNQSSQLMCAPMPSENQNMKQISQLEFTLLKTCQRMADSAIRMECSFCFQTYDTSDFYDHLVSEHGNQNLNKTQIQSQMNISTVNGNKQQYSSNKHTLILDRRQYVEDSNNNNIQLESTSPKIIPKFAKNSRSFTCLLNEIEEEEKINGNNSTQGSQIQQQQLPQKTLIVEEISYKQPKSQVPQPVHNHNKSTFVEEKKSRNIISHQTNNSTVLFGSGNTLNSVLRDQKKKKKGGNGAADGNTTVMTACRTEIQNLKRQNKQLNNKLQEQEHKINDVSKECSFIRKHSTQLDKSLKRDKNGNLTNEIKDLLEQLVSYQGINPGMKQSKAGGFTSRQYSNLPMSTESLVELRSSASSTNIGKQQKKNKHKKSSKSPFGQQQHASNKENIQSSTMYQKQHQKVPKLPLFKGEENHDSSSSQDAKITESQTVTERRKYKDVNKSEVMCSNSPQRYQNYFEEHQNANQNGCLQIQYKPQTQRQNRYSPQNNQNELMQSQQMMMVEVNSRNVNMPQIYNSKQFTATSSQNNLVLYDSSNTDMFKSKNLRFYQPYQQQNSNNINNVQGVRRLDFDKDSIGEDMNSCPSLEDYELNSTAKDGQVLNLVNNLTENDPFITGKFCDNNGSKKQFVFKQQHFGGKNDTIKTHNLINH